jgi:hypothetical protein
LYFHRGARFDNKLASTILNEERRVLLQRLNWGAVAATGWFESLAVAQFTRRDGRPLQRRLAETNFLSADCDLTAILAVYHKPLMMHDSCNQL